ncbi:putative amino-acid-binding protein YxeM precursor [Roseibium album]|nr:putative amino-acid-binding protein YxeM precursor [Roseibium album]
MVFRVSTLFVGMWLSLMWGGAGHADENSLLIIGFSTPPYLYVGPDDAPHGLLVDLVETAAANSDVQVRFEVTSWPRAQLEVRKGVADLIFPVVYTSEREDWLIYPSNPITQFEMMIFAKKNPNYVFTGDVTQLHGLLIGKIASGRMHPNFRALEDSGQANIEPRGSLEELLTAVDLGRLDGFVAPLLMTVEEARRKGLHSIKPFPDPVGVSDIYIAFSKNSTKTAAWNRLQKNLPRLDQARADFLLTKKPSR